MTKRLIDIDDELLTQAREILDVATMKDAVNAALESVVRAQLRRQHLARLEGGQGHDLGDDATLQNAWR